MGRERRCRSLHSQLSKAIAIGDVQKEVVVREKLGEWLRNKDDKEATQQFSQALEKAEEKETRLRLLNQLIELHALEGNRDKALECIEKSEKEATTSGDNHYAAYIASWSLLELHRAKIEDFVYKAQTKALLSMTLLKTEGSMIKSTLKYNESVEQREGRLSKLLAEIYGILGEKKEAEEYLECAKCLLPREQFEVVKVQEQFPWSDKLSLGGELLEVAKNEGERAEAHLIIAKAYLDAQSIDKGITALHDSYYGLSSKGRTVSDSTRKEWNRLAIIAVKARAEKGGDEEKAVLAGLDDGEILNTFKDSAESARRKKNAEKHQDSEFLRYGDTKIMLAIRRGRLDEVKRLIDDGHSVNERNTAGWTALHEAVSVQKDDLVDLVLAKGADPNIASPAGWLNSEFGGGITSLHEACFTGCVAIAHKLICAEADVTIANEDGWRPADFLNEHIKQRTADLDEENLDECRKLVELLKEEEIKAGFMRTADPEYPNMKNFYKEKEEEMGRNGRAKRKSAIAATQNISIVNRKKRKGDRKLKEDGMNREETEGGNEERDETEEELTVPAVKRSKTRVIPEEMDEGMHEFNDAEEERNEEIFNGVGTGPVELEVEVNTHGIENNRGENENVNLIPADASMETGTNEAKKVANPIDKTTQNSAQLRDKAQLCSIVKIEEDNDDSSYCEILNVKPDLVKTMHGQTMPAHNSVGNSLPFVPADPLIPIIVHIVNGEEKASHVIMASSGDLVPSLAKHPDLIEAIGRVECEWSCEGYKTKTVTVDVLSSLSSKKLIEVECKKKQ